MRRATSSRKLVSSRLVTKAFNSSASSLIAYTYYQQPTRKPHKILRRISWIIHAAAPDGEVECGDASPLLKRRHVAALPPQRWSGSVESLSVRIPVHFARGRFTRPGRELCIGFIRPPSLRRTAVLNWLRYFEDSFIWAIAVTVRSTRLRCCPRVIHVHAARRRAPFIPQ